MRALRRLEQPRVHDHVRHDAGVRNGVAEGGGGHGALLGRTRWVLRLPPRADRRRRAFRRQGDRRAGRERGQREHPAQPGGALRRGGPRRAGDLLLERARTAARARGGACRKRRARGGATPVARLREGRRLRHLQGRRARAARRVAHPRRLVRGRPLTARLRHARHHGQRRARLEGSVRALELDLARQPAPLRARRDADAVRGHRPPPARRAPVGHGASSTSACSRARRRAPPSRWSASAAP